MSRFIVFVALLPMLFVFKAAHANPLVLVDHAANACSSRDFGLTDDFRIVSGGFENVSTNKRVAVCSLSNVYDAQGGSTEYNTMNFSITASVPAGVGAEDMSCALRVRNPAASNAVISAFSFTVPAGTSGQIFPGFIDYAGAAVWTFNSYLQCSVPPGAAIFNVTTFNFADLPAF